MKVEQDGYVLVIQEVLDDKSKLDYYRTSCDINVFPETGIWKNCDLDTIITRFKRGVNSYLAKDIEDNKKKDEDLFIVETFIEKLTLINKEMELLRDNPHRYLVLDVKLGKLYEKAKEVFHLSSYESFKTFYNMNFKDK